MENYFTKMDTYIKNIHQIYERFHDEACILMITYLDELANYTYLPDEFGRNQNKKKFIRFITEFSGYSEYFDYIMMHKVLYLKDTCKNEKEKLAYISIYNMYKAKFDKFQEDINQEGQVSLSQSLIISEIKSTINFDRIFTNDQENISFFNRLAFGNTFYEYRNKCIHQYDNNFHSDFTDEPYYLNIECIDGGKDFTTFEIPFEFLYRVLINCYQNVKSNFNIRMNMLWDREE